MGSSPRGQRIGLVGCVKTKRTVATAAKDLYDSSLFHGQRRAVEASCDLWFILSAKHGLLDPHTEIEPYEEALYGASRRHDGWEARFTDIEDVLGTALPASARNHPAWWGMEATAHSHARAWIAGGFRTANVDLAEERVIFVRTRI